VCCIFVILSRNIPASFLWESFNSMFSIFCVDAMYPISCRLSPILGSLNSVFYTLYPIWYYCTGCKAGGGVSGRLYQQLLELP
jgi:hypothetical protein